MGGGPDQSFARRQSIPYGLGATLRVWQRHYYMKRYHRRGVRVGKMIMRVMHRGCRVAWSLSCLDFK